MATMKGKSLLKITMGNINLKDDFETQPAEWYELLDGTLHHKDSQEILDWLRLLDFEHPRIGTCVFIYSERHGKYLLGRRGKESHGAGQLAAPGGHLDLDETLEQCAAREVKEETGLILKYSRLLCTACDNFAFPRQARGDKLEVKTLKNYITCWMVGLMADPEAEAKAGVEPSI